MAGYSSTPLPKKLGIKAGHLVALVEAPPGIERTLGDMPEDVKLVRGTRASRAFDVILLFAKSSSMVEKRIAELASKLDHAGGLWVCWPKRASGIVSDLGDNEVRAFGLEIGLVDNKVCAVDETWSALRFMYRLKDRPPRR